MRKDLSKVFVVFFCLCCQFTFLTKVSQAQLVKTVGDEVGKLKESLEYDLKKYETISTKGIDLSDIIETLNNRTDTYIKLQKEQCDGEYSSIELDENGDQKVVRKKLSKLERNLCMLELVNFQRKFTEVVFELRKKLLQKQQQGQLDNLESYRQMQVNELEKMASKYK